MTTFFANGGKRGEKDQSGESASKPEKKLSDCKKAPLRRENKEKGRAYRRKGGGWEWVVTDQ